MDKKEAPCCSPTDKEMSCCKVESIISIDNRGQMVLPKEIREKAKIRAGDKLALVSWEKAGKVYCISIIRAEDFSRIVEGTLGPTVEEVSSK
ncbi:MAG: HgcAB-associated protein [Candidatus Bathyarchaeota archaeon]|nr:HgcAB-associated protein [Candidatus Bathyarchaeota archaeon]